MPLTARQESSDFNYELPPAGNQVARCYAVVDLGMQEKTWQGETKLVHQVRISWELPNALMEDGRPFSVSRSYTLSLSEKANLYQDLISWRGKPFTTEELVAFDLYNVLGAPCMINVIHKPSQDGSKTYANVGAVSPLPQGLDCPAQVNDTLKYSIEDHDDAAFNALPEWLQKKINRPTAQQYTEASPPPMVDDDIPFSNYEYRTLA